MSRIRGREICPCMHGCNADNRNAASSDTSFGELIDRSHRGAAALRESRCLVDRDGRGRRKERGRRNVAAHSARTERSRETERQRDREWERERGGSLKRRDISARFTFSTPFCLPVLPSSAFSLAFVPARTKKGLARPCESRANMHRERNYAASTLRSRGGAARHGTAPHRTAPPFPASTPKVRGGGGAREGELENLARAHTASSYFIAVPTLPSPPSPPPPPSACAQPFLPPAFCRSLAAR